MMRVAAVWSEAMRELAGEGSTFEEIARHAGATSHARVEQIINRRQ